MQEYLDEIFKPIRSNEKYAISNYGRVKHIRKGNILKTKISNGYEYNSTVGYIHRLVATHFLENKDNLPQVNHKDENKLNNKYNNLEWCTASYNVKYSSYKIKSNHSSIAKPVQMYDYDDNLINEFESIKDASRYINKPCGRKYISRCCRGISKHAYNYVWKFKK